MEWKQPTLTRGYDTVLHPLSGLSGGLLQEKGKGGRYHCLKVEYKTTSILLEHWLNQLCVTPMIQLRWVPQDIDRLRLVTSVLAKVMLLNPKKSEVSIT